MQNFSIRHLLSKNFWKESPLIQDFYLYMGQTALLALESFRSIFAGRIRLLLVLRQLVEIGYGSQFVVVVTGAFTGAVFTAQIFYQFSTLGMKVTQQIDALRALAVHPVDYLVVPRVVAMLISMPLLVAECVFFGILSSYFVATQILAIPSVYFLQNVWRFIDGHNLVMSLTKGFIFALIIVFISCQQGLTTREGAVGVGRATTEAVVISSLCILIGNFFLTMALNMVFPAGLR